jgi:hypothetical protein
LPVLRLTLLGLASLAGYKVTADPRNTDFGKIRDGDIHTDITGGAGAYLRLVAQEASKTQITADGKIRKMNTGKFNAPTRASVFWQFMRNKEAPDLSMINDWADGKNSVGEPFSWRSTAEEHLLPMVSNDMKAIVKERGVKGIAYAPADIFGAGVQVYGKKEHKRSSRRSLSGGSSL